MKACTKCGETKSLEEFHRFNAGRDGRRSECKDCSCARARAKYGPSRRDTEPTAATCGHRPCGKTFEYVRSTGPKRMYCSIQCKYRAGQAMKVEKAQVSIRRCACGSAEVHTVGKPVCRACRKDPRTSESNRARERRRILRLYSLTQAEYDVLVMRQGDRCAICRTDTPGGQGENWKVDHDHACCPGKGSCGRCVRGLLCNNCNLAMGYAGDDPARLRAAAAYIEAARQPALFVA